MDVPVFALPGVVLFPHALLPLHVFEPRYRTMVADALAADGTLAVALQKQCSPSEYEAGPPHHDVVCVGRIVTHDALADGRSNIAVLGVSAARVAAPGPPRPYNTARVEPVADAADAPADAAGRLAPWFDELDEIGERVASLVPEADRPAGLVNACALLAPVLSAHKQELLEERSVARRLERLLVFLERPWQWN